MLGTQDRRGVRTPDRRYSAYQTNPKDYFEDDYYFNAESALPRDDNYQDYLWDRLNNSNATATAPTYGDANSYYNPPIRGSARRVTDVAPVRTFNQANQQYKAKKTGLRGLNRQGKVILAVYLVVVVLIATLVIINADSINAGTAAEPSGAVQTVTPPISEGLYLLETPSAPQTVETNGFDRFLDKLFN